VQTPLQKFVQREKAEMPVVYQYNIANKKFRYFPMKFLRKNKGWGRKKKHIIQGIAISRELIGKGLRYN